MVPHAGKGCVRRGTRHLCWFTILQCLCDGKEIQEGLQGGIWAQRKGSSAGRAGALGAVDGLDWHIHLLGGASHHGEQR